MSYGETIPRSAEVGVHGHYRVSWEIAEVMTFGVEGPKFFLVSHEVEFYSIQKVRLSAP